MFGDKIKILRINRGLSQVDLAKILGVTKQSVSNWENENICPSIDMLIKIAQLFSVSTDYLLGLSEKHNLNTEGLTELQIAHIQAVINDILQMNYRLATFDSSTNIWGGEVIIYHQILKLGLRLHPQIDLFLHFLYLVFAFYCFIDNYFHTKSIVGGRFCREKDCITVC